MLTIYFAVSTAPGSDPPPAFLYVIIRFIAWSGREGDRRCPHTCRSQYHRERRLSRVAGTFASNIRAN
jgi:hypothetical protein